MNQYSQQPRSYPGTRPARPVTSATRPDDWLCCWSPHLVPETRKTYYWELKFIHRSCHLHNRLRTI